MQVLLSSALSFATTVAVLATPTTAQCGLDWLPGPIAAGPHGGVTSLATGAAGQVYAGGFFRYADAAITPGIAQWNGGSWTGVGGGVAGGLVRVLAVARTPNGDVYVGGDFTSAGGVPASNVARWDGTSWSALGSGTNNDVTALLALSNGDVIAGGLFQTAGGVAAPRVARWNGTAWSALGTGPSGTPYALAQRPNGDLVAAGTVGAAATLWNGTTWTPIVDGDFGRALAVLGNGDVVVGGQVLGPSGTNLMRWDGATATPFANPLPGPVNTLSVAPNGDLVAGSVTTTNPALRLARWDGAAWTPFANAPAAAALAHDSSGALVAATAVGEPGAQPGRTVLRWNGSVFVPLGNPVVPPVVSALVRAGDGDVFAGGVFAALGAATRNVARWNGAAWSDLGGGVGGAVHALAVAGNGDLVVSGEFQEAGGAPANRVARWTGTAWTTLGSGLAAPARSLAVAPNGDVFAVAGYDQVLRHFDGLAWSSIPLPAGTVGSARVLTTLPDGAIVVGGMLGGLWRYRHGVFTAIGYPGTVIALAVAPDGALVASGSGYIQRWDGTSWTMLAQGATTALGLTFLPDGDLIAVGLFSFGGTQVGVWRFDGATWSIVDGGITRGAPAVVAASEHGDLFVGGNVEIAGGQLSLGLARARTSCLAAAVPFGAGCAGGGGPMVLAANDLPWAGGTLTSTATGFPAGALGLLVAGDQPLVQPLPLGAPGCSLFVAPLVLDLLLPQNGAATATLLVPASASLAGLVFREQVVGLELDALGGLTRVTSTNALALTIGAL